MLRLFLRRLLESIPTLLILIAVTFFMMRMAPGGPFDTREAAGAGDRGEPAGRLPPGRAALPAVRPLPVEPGPGRLRAVLPVPGPDGHGADRAAASPCRCSWAASPCSSRWSVGVALGSLAALRQNKPADYGTMAVAMTGISVPNFVVAPLLVLVFAVYLGWLPAGGLGEGAAGGRLEEPGAAGDHAGPHPGGLHRPAHPGQHDRGPAQQLHPHRPGPGAADAAPSCSATR